MRVTKGPPLSPTARPQLVCSALCTQCSFAVLTHSKRRRSSVSGRNSVCFTLKAEKIISNKSPFSELDTV